MTFFEKFLNLFRPKKIQSNEDVIYYFGNDEYLRGIDLINTLKGLQRPIGKVSSQICE
jgi:hypothetical protein